jgi:hypothetical protein
VTGVLVASDLIRVVLLVMFPVIALFVLRF